MDDIIRIIKSLENPGVLIDGVSKTVKSEIKQEGGFLGMLFGTFGTFDAILWNMLTGKRVMRNWKAVVRAGRWYYIMDRMNTIFCLCFIV